MLHLLNDFLLPLLLRFNGFSLRGSAFCALAVAHVLHSCYSLRTVYQLVFVANWPTTPSPFLP